MGWFRKEGAPFLRLQHPKGASGLRALPPASSPSSSKRSPGATLAARSPYPNRRPGHVGVWRSGGCEDGADRNHPRQRRNHNTRHRHGAPTSATTRHDPRTSRHGGSCGANICQGEAVRATKNGHEEWPISLCENGFEPKARTRSVQRSPWFAPPNRPWVHQSMRRGGASRHTYDRKLSIFAKLFLLNMKSDLSTNFSTKS